MDCFHTHLHLQKKNRSENVAEFGYNETPLTDEKNLHRPFHLVSLNYGVAKELALRYAISSVLCKTLEVKYIYV